MKEQREAAVAQSEAQEGEYDNKSMKGGAATSVKGADNKSVKGAQSNAGGADGEVAGPTEEDAPGAAEPGTKQTTTSKRTFKSSKQGGKQTTAKEEA